VKFCGLLVGGNTDYCPEEIVAIIYLSHELDADQPPLIGDASIKTTRVTRVMRAAGEALRGNRFPRQNPHDHH
jgi:hypothetical protein